MRHLIPELILQQHAAGNSSGCFGAAALFADISGYTPLTATLMQHQRDGAEALSNALYAIFGSLVESVYHHGGIVTLFSGDAVTAIFPLVDDDFGVAARDAANRALLTACEIQAYFLPSGTARQIETPYGTFDVACKIGLSLGEVTWGIVNADDRYTFYFYGDALTACAEAEELADSGQVVIDDSVHDLLGNDSKVSLIGSPGYYRLIDFPPVAYPVRPIPPAPTRTQLAPFLPSAVLGLSLDAEFRELCAIFLLFQAPEDELGLQCLASKVLEMSGRYGGTLLQMEFGDKGSLAIVLFGAPIAYERNAERAARFLLTARTELETPIRAGLASGIAWAGFLGGEGAMRTRRWAT